ncbi:MAG: hypothetical protein N2645_04520 [Clostridia bacterium]|nr:hypothetical protein [Clostridia bacterium]
MDRLGTGKYQFSQGTSDTGEEIMNIDKNKLNYIINTLYFLLYLLCLINFLGTSLFHKMEQKIGSKFFALLLVLGASLLFIILCTLLYKKIKIAFFTLYFLLCFPGIIAVSKLNWLEIKSSNPPVLTAFLVSFALIGVLFISRISYFLEQYDFWVVRGASMEKLQEIFQNRVYLLSRVVIFTLILVSLIMLFWNAVTFFGIRITEPLILVSLGVFIIILCILYFIIAAFKQPKNHQ